MSSWGTAKLVLDAEVMQRIRNAIDEYHRTGKSVPVTVLPHFTIDYGEVTFDNQMIRQLTISSPVEIEHSVAIEIASNFGFQSAPQRWTITSDVQGDVYTAYVMAPY